MRRPGTSSRFFGSRAARRRNRTTRHREPAGAGHCRRGAARVDGARLRSFDFQVLKKALSPALSPEAALFEASERRARVELVVRVAPNDARFEPAGNFEK